MSESPTFCPYLGLAGDRTVVRRGPNASHRCYAVLPPAAPDLDHQHSLCLSGRYAECPFYSAHLVQPPAAGAQQKPAPRRWPVALAWAALAVLLVAVVLVYLKDSGLLNGAAAGPSAAATTAASPTKSRDAPAAMPASGTSAASATSLPRYASPTPEPGGRTISLASKQGDAGWWTGAESRGNHLGDSFLYAGFTNGQAFASAAQFDLSSVPRGATVRSAELRLMGLNDGRFDANAGGTWSVQMLPASSLPEYARTDFQALLNAPAAVTLFPAFFAADLQAGKENVARLDESGRAWLEKLVAGGEKGVIARIVGPGGGNTLFAWDSGAGPATMGEGPQLVLALGPAPATAPPLPTEKVGVATDTPTPSNVLTAAANALTATRVAQDGTPAYRYVTPTPSPANLATVQARALQLGLVPIVPHTATPANEATRQALWLIATAEAFLTGTPTPPPPGYVTPVFVTPTEVPANVLTAAADARRATAEAAKVGTPTAWAYNVVVATATPPVFVIVNTPVPANAATARAQAAYATAVAMLTGTFTPFPYNAVTATPVARPTATPSAEELGYLCPDPRAQISFPRPRQLVNQELELRGRAVSANFAGYTLEVAPGALPDTGYEEILRGQNKVEDGALGVFVVSALPDGTYTVSLQVKASAGEAPPPCRVVIEVRNR